MTPATPQTRSSLARDLRRLGLRRGDTVLVHSSLRALGWVCGGAPTVVRALLDVLSEDGTLVVPAQTPENRDPSCWRDVPVPRSWWTVIREELPAFDPATSPSHSGLISETVRTWPGSVRSAHPQTSFAAVGRLANSLMGRHLITSELGEESPLRALETVDGRTLLLGVGYDRCTAFHLAEYRLPGLRRRRTNACVVMTPAGRRWVRYEGAELDASCFAELGDAYESTSGSVAVGTVGAAAARLLRIRDAVGFAVDWLLAHRGAVVGPRS
jgi:aminoglycoside 3-N-acetyltransferase